jgi:hypothetical protein
MGYLRSETLNVLRVTEEKPWEQETPTFSSSMVREASSVHAHLSRSFSCGRSESTVDRSTQTLFSPMKSSVIPKTCFQLSPVSTCRVQASNLHTPPFQKDTEKGLACALQILPHLVKGLRHEPDSETHPQLGRYPCLKSSQGLLPLQRRLFPASLLCTLGLRTALDEGLL